MKQIGLDLFADGGKWLCRGKGESKMFWKSITLAKIENINYYNECTNEDYLAWKAEYEPEPEPLPEEVEEAEIVE